MRASKRFARARAGAHDQPYRILWGIPSRSLAKPLRLSRPRSAQPVAGDDRPLRGHSRAMARRRTFHISIELVGKKWHNSFRANCYPPHRTMPELCLLQAQPKPIASTKPTSKQSRSRLPDGVTAAQAFSDLLRKRSRECPAMAASTFRSS